jgi:hypothetical protein
MCTRTNRSGENTLEAKITRLQTVDSDLHLQLDDIEQYGRWPLVRISGIPETPDENTTNLILDVTTRAGISLTHDGMFNSHHV